MSKLILSLLLILLWMQSGMQAKDYSNRFRPSRNFYFSNNGNDDNDGRSGQTAWRHINRLSEAGRLQAGDSVLLERGSIFNGSLIVEGDGSEASAIYVGAYGEGERPVIIGSTTIAEWEPYEGSIWVARCADCGGMPGDIFANGVAQPLGRYPDDGYLMITRLVGETKTLADTSMLFADHFWDGAEIVVRSSRWTIDRLRAHIYQEKSFTFSGPLSYEPVPDTGYFLQNHLRTLDRNGEWYFDESSGRIFLYWKEGSDRPRHISASVFDQGIQISGSDHVTVENIVIKQFRKIGVRVSDSHNVVLRYLEISGSGQDGLQVVACENPLVENCALSDSNNNGVVWENNSGGVFAGNTILRTGLRAGRGGSGNGTYIAFYATGHAGRPNVIRNNTIEHTGYSAIDFRTSPTTISHNVIRSFCLVKDDGGGIYTWNNPHPGNAIEDNIILDGIGAGAGTNDPGQRYTSGIYIDDDSQNLRITGNTIGFCATAGIFIHNARNLEIKHNNMLANGSHLTNHEKGELLIRRDASAAQPLSGQLNLDVRNNLLFAADETSYCIYFSEHGRDLMKPGKFTGNTFRARKPDNAIAVSFEDSGLCHAPERFDLKKWQDETSLENGSTFQLTDLVYPGLKGRNMIANGTMNRGVEGWFVWPDDASMRRVNLEGSPSLEVQVSRSGEALLYHAGFGLEKGKIYCLSFSAKAVEKSKMEFAPLAAMDPWNALASYSCFSLDTCFQKFSLFFTPEVSAVEARLNFKSIVAFWVDDVSLFEVSATVGRDALLQLFPTLRASDRNVPIPGNETGQRKERLGSEP